MNQTAIVAIVCLLVGVGGTTAYFTLIAPGGPPPTEDADAPDRAEKPADGGAYCAEHKIAEADCPFCNQTIVEERGECEAHGFPEALCYQCNPKLMAAFKAEGDWCAGHKVPESQCALCDFGKIHEGPNAKPKE